MIPNKIPIDSIFGTLSQLIMHLCSVCSIGFPPQPDKQPRSFHLPARPSLIASCYFSDLISFSLLYSAPGILASYLRALARVAPVSTQFIPSPQPPCSQWGLPWPPGFGLSLPISFPYFVFLHLIYHLLTLCIFDWLNLFISLSQLECTYHVDRVFPVLFTVVFVVLRPLLGAY